MKKTLTISIVLLAIILSACNSRSHNNYDNNNFDVNIDSIIPTETTENVCFSEHMGTWYYTSYTDYRREDITKVEITAVGADEAKIEYSDGSTEYITFKSENIAEGYDYNSDPNVLRSITIRYEFKNEHGKEHIEITPTFSDTGEVSAQPGPGMYRSIDDFFLESSEQKGSTVSNNDSDMKVVDTKRDDFKRRMTELENYENDRTGNAMTQTEINQATYAVYQKWDALLNEIYQYLKNTLPDAEFSSLQADEKDWIQKKEAAMAAAAAEYAGGSMAPMASNSKGAQYTKERCEYLISLIK